MTSMHLFRILDLLPVALSVSMVSLRKLTLRDAALVTDSVILRRVSSAVLSYMRSAAARSRFMDSPPLQKERVSNLNRQT
jgi:hypothetical protein